MLFRQSLAVALLLSTSVAAANDSFSWVKSSDGAIDLMYGEAPVLRYMHAFDTSTPEAVHDTYKVFHHVFGPQSGQQITKGPGGKFTHHRGLYVGWNQTKTTDGVFDFWHCKNGAHLKHINILAQKADAQMGHMTVQIHWNDADSKPVIQEIRNITVRPVTINDGRAWQIDWSSRLESKRGAIQLRGDRQHSGFQFRANQPVADASSATYIRPKGFPEQPEAFQVNDRQDPNGHINLNWFAMHYPLGESEYTVEYFEAPGQPQPSRYSERPYGRFGAFYEADLDAGKPLQMQYRVFVSEGAAPARDDIQKRYDAFAKSLKKRTGE